MMWNRSGGWGDWLAMSLLMLVFWAVVVARSVVLVRSVRGSTR